MRTIVVRNVHDALPRALQLLDGEGIRRESRNGPVLMIPGGVVTVYTQPTERVLFWAQRDANPFFHLYESIWMLDGREDVQVLGRYAKQVLEYSDDGVTMHGAYGYRWRSKFGVGGLDQLKLVEKRLKANPDDRRCVVQMWSAEADLDNSSKDVPCNLTITFQRDAAGHLDMVVFNRSNDVIWGCYGANAVHFSVLQEYVASQIGCEVGTYTQVSVNWHAYLDQYEKLRALPRPSTVRPPGGLYGSGDVWTIPMGGVTRDDLKVLLYKADSAYQSHGTEYATPHFHPWVMMVDRMLRAHHAWRVLEAPDRYRVALDILSEGDALYDSDWLTAGREWVQRRYDKYQKEAV